MVIIEVSHDHLLIFPMPAAMAATAYFMLLVPCSVLSRLHHHAPQDAG